MTLALAALPAWAASPSDLSVTSARKARLSTQNLRLLIEKPAQDQPEPPPPFSVTFGLAFDQDEARTRATTTPILVSYDVPRMSGLTLQLLSDGYSRSSSPGESGTSGLADVELNVYKDFGWGLRFGGGASVPTGGEVGGSDATQHVRLVYSRKLPAGRWSTLSWVDLRHFDETEAGVGRHSTKLYAELSYSLADRTTLLAGVLRRWQRGAPTPATTDLSLELDFPLLGKIDGALALGRGVSAGARHTSVEFNLTFAF
jgi:hypothetical protein